MEDYDINILFGKVIMEVTIQIWKYKGHYRIEMSGNIKGAAFLEEAFDTECLKNSDILWSDCKLKIQENYEGDMIFSAELEDVKGDILVVDGNSDELRNCIVGVKILQFTED